MKTPPLVQEVAIYMLVIACQASALLLPVRHVASAATAADCPTLRCPSCYMMPYNFVRNSQG
jgi:hypothetical protein